MLFILDSTRDDIEGSQENPPEMKQKVQGATVKPEVTLVLSIFVKIIIKRKLLLNLTANF